MKIKYAYSYEDDQGTFYVRLDSEVIKCGMSALDMSRTAQVEGGMISWLRRQVAQKIGKNSHFELEPVKLEDINGSTDRS